MTTIKEAEKAWQEAALAEQALENDLAAFAWRLSAKERVSRRAEVRMREDAIMMARRRTTVAREKLETLRRETAA